MNQNQNSVVAENEGIVLDDAVQAQETKENVSKLEELVDEQETKRQTVKAEQTESQQTEPGWYKKRAAKDIERAVRETEARMRAEFESQFAPFKEAFMEQQAQALVDSGEMKNIETAKEYVRLKNGNVDIPKKNRDEKGRFAPEADPETLARARVLAKQAQKLKNKHGIDFMELYNNDPEIKQKIISGEWDFYDVADSIKTENKQNRVPPPMRTPNGNNSSRVSISKMTKEQFAKLNEMLESGRKYEMR